MDKPTPEKMKEMVSLLLSRAQDSLDESHWNDRAQDVADDTRDCAQKILENAGFSPKAFDDDEWDKLVSELAEGITWVPENFKLTK